MTQNEELMLIKKHYNLTNMDISRLLNVCHSTVRNWVSNPERNNFRHVSLGMLELLKLKLGDKT